MSDMSSNLRIWLALLCIVTVVVSQNQGGQQLDNGKEIIDDCCCDVDTVVDNNVKELNPQLNQLVKRPFFRYFKLDLFSGCPFWASEFLCGLGNCGVCECNEDEIPTFWKELKTDLVDVTTPENFVSWVDAPQHMWIVPGKEEDLSYVNLGDYPEGFTSYDGRIIWESIYNENCFTGPMDSLCLEERVFYRLISGLHFSVSVHIAHNYKRDEDSGVWTSNITEYYSKAIGNQPERKKNLYFAYLFLLRAVYRLAPMLEKYPYNTGNSTEDLQVLQSMKQLLSTNLLCAPTFDESILFSDPEKESLRNQTKSHFRNISLIMDCVTCEKCRVYGKLQILALGTALRILLEPNQETAMKILQRNEIIALINTLRQFSNSIQWAEEFENERNGPRSARNSTLPIANNRDLVIIGATTAVIVVVLSSFYCCFRSGVATPKTPRSRPRRDSVLITRYTMQKSKST